eukprot:1154256-Pelagomonas_calceolata.AAC.5
MRKRAAPAGAPFTWRYLSSWRLAWASFATCWAQALSQLRPVRSSYDALNLYWKYWKQNDRQLCKQADVAADYGCKIARVLSLKSTSGPITSICT